MNITNLTLSSINVSKQPVAWISNDIFEMWDDWNRINALMGGTKTMRLAGGKYLPQWPKEEPDVYTNRLQQATLFPAFSRTVITLVGKPMSRAVTVNEDAPTQITDLLDDIDLEGRDLTSFVNDILTETVAKGIAGILVDFTRRDRVVNTIQAEKEAGLRPYFVKISFSDVLGYKVTTINGKKQLTQLRFYEYIQADSDNKYTTNKIRQIRVVEPNSYEIWRQDPEKPDHWNLIEQGETTAGKIMFVPLYGEYLSFMKGRSPLLELANLNIKHWQSQSDQDNILHVIRCPILTYQSDIDANTGLPKFDLTISPNMGVAIPEGSEVKYVEHTGKAVEAGKTSLDDLKDEMRQAGAELLVMRMAQATATEIQADNSVGTCALQRIVKNVNDGINLALQYMADWLKISEGGTIQIYNEFGLSSIDDAMAQLLYTMSDASKSEPVISRKRVYLELQRGGVLSPDISYEDELKDIADQPKPPPPPARIAAPGPIKNIPKT